MVREVEMLRLRAVQIYFAGVTALSTARAQAGGVG